MGAGCEREAVPESKRAPMDPVTPYLDLANQRLDLLNLGGKRKKTQACSKVPHEAAGYPLDPPGLLIRTVTASTLLRPRIRAVRRCTVPGTHPLRWSPPTAAA